jgi:HD-like signal output (HDOD) protein
MADNLLSDWVARINKREIPIFRSTVTSIANLAASNLSSTSELASAILRDPALTARILKFANSSFYSSAGPGTSTITRAVVVLGFESVRELSLSLAIIDSLLTSEYRDQVQELMAHAFHAAVQVRAIAERKGEGNIEEIFIATLLLDIGVMAFYCTATEEEIAALRQAEEKPGRSALQAQKQALGFTFEELTRSLIAHWKLSPTLTRFLASANAQDGRSRCIRLGRNFAKVITNGWESEEVDKATRDIADFAGITVAESKKMLRGGARLAAEVAKNYGAQNVARLIPGWEEPTTKEGEDGPTPRFPPPDLTLQLKVLRELSSILRTKADLNLVLEILLEGIHRGVGMDRAVFALYSPVRAQIRAKYVLGCDAETLLEQFTFPVDTGIGNPFSDTLFGKGAGLWVKNVLDSGFSQLVTTQIRDILGAKAFFLTPIFVGGKAIGLFYADRHPSRRPLDLAAFESFEHMGQQACLSIEHIMRQERK